jgi:hypothetical protein
MNAYLGMMKHYKTHRLRKKMVFKLLSGWWWNRVYLSGGIAKFVMKVKPAKTKGGIDIQQKVNQSGTDHDYCFKLTSSHWPIIRSQYKYLRVYYQESLGI